MQKICGTHCHRRLFLKADWIMSWKWGPSMSIRHDCFYETFRTNSGMSQNRNCAETTVWLSCFVWLPRASGRMPQEVGTEGHSLVLSSNSLLMWAANFTTTWSPLPGTPFLITICGLNIHVHKTILGWGRTEDRDLQKTKIISIQNRVINTYYKFIHHHPWNLFNGSNQSNLRTVSFEWLKYR